MTLDTNAEALELSADARPRVSVRAFVVLAAILLAALALRLALCPKLLLLAKPWNSDLASRTRFFITKLTTGPVDMTSMFRAENIRIQIGDPLLAVLGYTQIS